MTANVSHVLVFVCLIQCLVIFVVGALVSLWWYPDDLRRNPACLIEHNRCTVCHNASTNSRLLFLLILLFHHHPATPSQAGAKRKNEKKGQSKNRKSTKNGKGYLSFEQTPTTPPPPPPPSYALNGLARIYMLISC